MKKEHVISKINNDTLLQAIYFATERHCGQCRKGTHTPFIIHPLETMTILASMKADTNLLVAGLLHDIVEDTDTSIEEIRQLFGNDVAELVGGHTEDKRQSWKERKQAEIDGCREASERLKMLILADKLANLRSMYVDYRDEGEVFWERFNAPKEMQAWYYGGVQDALYEMQLYSNTAQAYWEMVELYKDIFVSFRVDKEKGLLYQICADGETYCLKKGNPEWKSYEGKISQKVEELPRKQAERLEENIDDIAAGTAAILVKDESLRENPDAEFYKYLKAEGFQMWSKSKGCYKGVDWIYVNLNTKCIARGMPGIPVVSAFGNHAVTIDEFKEIYRIYKKYTGMSVFQFVHTEQET